MSGHSKFANIKHKKERNDAAKGKIFTIIGREIAIAVKEGGPDPNNNSKLRDVVAKAKAANMPNETIARGIKKAAGDADSVNYEEVSYEGYGPNGVAIVVDCLTDNRNRTAADVRAAFSKNGGNVGTPGCVSFMFDKKGQIIVDKEECSLSSDDLMMAALDAGAEDINEEEDSYEILTDPNTFSEVRQKLEEAGIPMASADVTMIPQNYVSVDSEEASKQLTRLLDTLDENDDVQAVYSNLEESDSAHDALLNAFSRKLYAEQFKDYYMSLIPAMDAIENLYAAVVEKDTMLENMAQELVTSASQMLDAAPRREKERLNINLSLAMAGYVFPALLKYQGSSSKPLVDHVSKAWKRAFPKSNLTPAEYDVIEKGFHKKFCFITTACCRRLNRPDDCYELTLLRTYRDQYMAFLPDGEKLIEMYYDVAPSIVKHIDRLQDADRIYDGIWDTYIQPCIRLIECGKNEECRALYTQMVLDLKSRYFLTEPARTCTSSGIA